MSGGTTRGAGEGKASSTMARTCRRKACDGQGAERLSGRANGLTPLRALARLRSTGAPLGGARHQRSAAAAAAHLLQHLRGGQVGQALLDHLFVEAEGFGVQVFAEPGVGHYVLQQQYRRYRREPRQQACRGVALFEHECARGAA